MRQCSMRYLQIAQEALQQRPPAVGQHRRRHALPGLLVDETQAIASAWWTGLL